MMPTCKEVSRLVSQGLDRRLSLRERIALRIHLAMCHGCESFARQMQFLRRAAQGLAATNDSDKR